MEEQHDPQPPPATAPCRPVPLDYAKAEPEPDRWGWFYLSLAVMGPAVVMSSSGFREAFGRRWLLVSVPACPFGMLATILHDRYGGIPWMIGLMLLVLPWPAYGLALTWAGWCGDRRRVIRTAGVLAAVHTAAISCRCRPRHGLMAQFTARM